MISCMLNIEFSNQTGLIRASLDGSNTWMMDQWRLVDEGRVRSASAISPSPPFLSYAAFGVFVVIANE